MWHFTGKTLRNGDPLPPIGEWLTYDGPIVMCELGLHASPTPFQALQYAPGIFLHKVILEGDVVTKDDKSGRRRMKILGTINAEDMLLRFSRTVALNVAHLWKAPPVVVEYLRTGNLLLRDAARAAARAAGWSAGRDSARAAERAAARAAAWATSWVDAGDSAWATVRAAGWAAPGSRKRYAAIFNQMVEDEFLKTEAQ
jgi:hypothetical protein